MKYIFLSILMSAIFFHTIADTQVHVVQRGETLETIADKYGVRVQQIKELNPTMSHFLFVGLKLNIPEGRSKESVSGNPSVKLEQQTEKASSVQALEKNTIDARNNIGSNVAYAYSQVDNSNNINVENSGIPTGFIIAKYDKIDLADSDLSLDGISVGILTNPLEEGKKISYTMQLGAFLDYYQSSTDYVDMHYFGLSIPFHLLGCQFSDGRGNGVSIHGGFEFTWRIDGSGKNKVFDTSFNPFAEEDVGEGRLRHWDAGFSGAVDVCLSKFYASFGYKIFANLVKDKNSYGPFFVIGYDF